MKAEPSGRAVCGVDYTGVPSLATRKRVHSTAGERAASELATPSTRMNKNAGQSATSSNQFIRCLRA